MPRPGWLLAGLALACLAARRRVVLVTVRGNSMLPTYESGDVLLGVRSTAPRRGSAVVFRPPYAACDPPYRIKRVVALAGDRTPDWVRGEPAGGRVPAGHVVVRGDDASSEDSRHYGYVPAVSVLAVVVGRLRVTRGRR